MNSSARPQITSTWPMRRANTLMNIAQINSTEAWSPGKLWLERSFNSQVFSNPGKKSLI